MADTLESLEVKVKHSASGADAEINNVANAVGLLKANLQGTPAALKDLVEAFNSIQGAFKKGLGSNLSAVAEGIADIGAAANLVGDGSSISTLSEALSSLAALNISPAMLKNTATAILDLAAAVVDIPQETIQIMAEFGASISTLSGLELNPASINRMATAVSNIAIATFGLNEQSLNTLASLGAALAPLSELANNTTALNGIGRGIQAIAYSAALITPQSLHNLRELADALSGMTGVGNTNLGGLGRALNTTRNSIKKTGDEAKKSAGKLATFVASLKRIAFYRFIRTVIKSISQAFTEGLKNAYLFSSGLTTEGHRFAAAMDSMKSASTQMKNQLGSAFIALLTAIEPVVTAIVNLIIRLADAVSQFISAFTGKTYLKAAVVSDKFADDMASGAKSAKEWKNQLLGFDVINRLNEPSDGGGGGGLTPQDMFGWTDTPINEKFLNAVEKIKEFFAGLDTGPLNEAISKIRDELKPILEKVGDICSWLWDNILAR